ncbi:retinitis pigmentosa 1-like 1 protein [Bubalus bubalis]|uniref:retinitis pigmentosa 1-like 1 protein n=1 Tax=Bubalus bubalis TaxID=89462 RepID=UPI001E1B6584|nr:retinitis pigmentosa 1-like 1 protein [Bubalus bubalis]
MNSTPRDALAPSHRECLLPSVARTPSVTQVTPAKKITFLKRGDPRFAGVRMAVHQRAFRSFGALMDELSQRVPLSFGVRSVTTPRGLHGLSTLEQLQDGGCYLCSDKKPPRTPGGLGQPRERNPSAQHLREFEAPGTASTCKGLKASRRITLVKNGDPRLQQTVVLSHRNTRNLTAFLSKASDLLCFPVKHVYTTSGKRVDSLKALLRSPSVLVCAGLEPFRPLVMEDIRRKGSEPSSGQTSRNKSGSWGPKAKQSVIHARSRLENRPRQFSLMSERSGHSDPSVCPHRACMCPAPDRHPLNTPAQLSPLVTGEDIEKNVSMNEDGSLSVEMKVRFHLLGEDPLLWSRRLGRASTHTVTSGEGPDAGEVDLLGCVWKGHSGDPSEPGAQGLGPCEAGGVGAFDQGQRQQGSRYEIWMNPLYISQGEWSACRWRSGLTQNSHSRAPRSQRVASRKRGSKDRASPASSDTPPGGSELNSSCCSGSLEDPVASCGPHLASGAGEGKGKGAALGCRDHDGCLKPRTRGLTDALPDSSASARSHEECSKRDKLSQGRPSKTPHGATQQGVPGSPTVSPSSIVNKDPQAEEFGQGAGHPQAINRSGVRPPSTRGPAASGDDAGGYTPPSACASALGRSRKQESRASTLCSAGSSVPSQRAQRACPRQHHSPKDIHCPLDSSVSRPMPGLSSRDRAHPHGPSPSLSESPQGTWNQASWDPGPPFSVSLYSQDTRRLSSIPITPGSNSDCVSNFYLPDSPSAETEGGPEFRPCSVALTPSNTSGPFSAPADGLGEKTGDDRFQPSWPLVQPAGWPEGGRLGAQWGSCCSHLGTSLARGASCGTIQTIPAPQPQGSQGPSSKACWVCSRYCPTPPRTRPLGKRHPSGSRSEGDRSADGKPSGEQVGEEKLDAWHPRPPGFQGAASGRAVRAVRRGSPRSGPQLRRMVQGKLSGRGGGLEEPEEGGSELLGALPRASPEAVVREWLSNIPEEPIKHELEDKGEDVAGHGLEGPQEDPVDKHSPDSLERSVWAGQLPQEQAASEEAEPDKAFPVASSASPKSGEGLPCRGVSETPTEAGTGKGVAVDSGRGQRVLPSRVSTSLQIMKALMGSRPGRPSSLPEVSHSAGRRLSHSAQALITCLARLHFFDDDDLGSPTSKVRFTDSPRYQELLSTFQALWPGSGFRNTELELDLRELGWRQALPALGPHVATEDFRPTSSSGVDVGSGSGGSGEGSGPCTVDCSLVSEKMELPLSISCQGPDSRTLGDPEVLGNQQLSSYEAEGAASEDGAEKNGREQTLGGDPDQGDKDTMQEERVQLEEIKEEKERAELQVEGVRGFPEEEGIMERGLSGVGSQDGAGVWENKSLHEEEPGDPTAVAMQSSWERRGSPPEPPRSLSERYLDASGSQSGPKAEPPLEKLLGAAETGCGQTLDKITQGAGERGTCKGHRGSLISDPVWVSKLLKKMEKAFMDHLATATAELCTRWGLQGDHLLDQMVAELQRDVGQRLQDSVEKELLKVQSWAGGTGTGLPREALHWEASLQTEQRRRRLQALRNLSPFSEQTRGRGPPSFSLEDLPIFRGALGTQLGVEAKGEEFCPCEACVRKKMVPASPVDAVGSASAPIRKAFDLQHILQKKKGGCADGETAEVAPAVEREVEPLHSDPSRTSTVRGADGDPELGSGQGPRAEEGDQTFGRDEDPWGTEEEGGAQEKERKTEPCVGSDPWEGLGRGEQGMGGEEGDLEAGCRAEDTGEAHGLGGGGLGPCRQDAGAETTEALEAARQERSEAGGGHGGDEEGGLQVGLGCGQSREASGDRSPTPGADPPQQRSGPGSGLSSFSTSSLGSCSLLSQKGSEDEPWDRCMRSTEDQAMDIPDPERKVTGMYPETNASEQEGDPSGTRTPEQGTEEGLSPEQSKEEGLAPEQEGGEGAAPEQEAEEASYTPQRLYRKAWLLLRPRLKPMDRTQVSRWRLGHFFQSTAHLPRVDPTAFPFTSVTVTDIITLHADLTETLTKKPWMAMVGFRLPKMPTGYTLTRRLSSSDTPASSSVIPKCFAPKPFLGPWVSAPQQEQRKMPPEDGSRYCLMNFMWLSIHCVDVSFCSIPADDVSTFGTIRAHTYSPRPPFQEASLKPSESQESPQNAAEAAILESTQEGPHVLVVSLKPSQG